MKPIVLAISCLLFVGLITGCSRTGSNSNTMYVPVFSISGLTSKEMSNKSVRVDDTNLDDGLFAFLFSMFHGFANVSEDEVSSTYSTEVINDLYNFTVTISGSDTTFQSVTPDGTLSVTVSDTAFTISENFIFVANIPSMGITEDTTIYREVSFTSEVGDSPEVYHIQTTLKHYDRDSNGATYRINWIEIFKNTQILGALIKSEYVDDITYVSNLSSPDPLTDLGAVQAILTAFNPSSPGRGVAYYMGDNAGTGGNRIQCILLVYNLSTGLFEYGAANALFTGTIAGNLTTYTNGTVSLQTVLDNYGWTLFP